MVKKVLIGIGGLLGLGVLAVVGKFYIASPASAPAEDLTAPTDEASIAEGKYLATHVYACLACHSELDEEVPGEPLVAGRLGSGRIFPVDPYGGSILKPPNLTPYNLKDWTDGEIVRAMREGVTKDGEPIFPMMPYTVYAKIMPKEQALKIVAYLRTLEPIENDVGDSEVPFPISMFVRAAPAPVESEPPAVPAEGAARGEWLAKAMVCAECHTSVDEQRQPIPGMDYAGGVRFTHGEQVIKTPNITQHEGTGIGVYSEEEIANAVFRGKARDGRDLYIMPWTWYAGLTPEDQALLAAKVKTFTAVEHKVERLAAH